MAKPKDKAELFEVGDEVIIVDFDGPHPENIERFNGAKGVISEVFDDHYKMVTDDCGNIYVSDHELAHISVPFVDARSRAIMYMAIESPALFKRLVLTRQQSEIVKLAQENGSISTKSLSQDRMISIQNASAQLVKLCAKGYFKREERVCPTGGIVYDYIPVI